MKHKNPLTLICIIAFLLLSSTASFSGSGSDEEAPSKKTFKVILASMGGNYPSSVTGKDNQHPYDIPEEVFSRLLSNLSYRNKRKAMGGWEENSVPIYSDKTAAQAAKYLREAFLKAKPGQKVVFTNYTSKGDTICDIFVQKETMNWKFSFVQGQSSTKAMWMLAKGYMQDYYGTGTKLLSVQGLLGGGNYEDLTWVQIPLIQYIAEVKGENKIVQEAGGKGDKGGSIDGKDKLEKMKKLAAMYHKKLLTEDEFRAKAGELMQKSAGEKLEIESELEYLKILKDEKLISKDAYMQKRNMVLEKF
ncbi:MAG: hypothetical protein HZA01_01250 [Nitrospinae bacterium]|nr:hypothetical protein [Nitrospinota bacterium]